MKKRRLGLLTALIIVTIFGSMFAINRIRAEQIATPDSGSEVINICTGIAQAQEQNNDQPCAIGSAGDAQAYGFGTTCTPTSTANPAMCNGQFGPAGVGLGTSVRTAKSLVITIVFSNPDLTGGAFVLAVKMLNSFGRQFVADGGGFNCYGAADFATGVNTGQEGAPFDTGGCNDSSTTTLNNPFAIHPGHCSITGTPSSCADPSTGAFTIRETPASSLLAGFSNGGPNVLELDFYSGQNIVIHNIQAVIGYS